MATTDAGAAGGRPAPLLVFGCGNPSRGDDALGPLLLERVEAAVAGEGRGREVECLQDFQLQVEHAVDLLGRRAVVFVDAGVGCAPPFGWTALSPARDASFSTHAMSPAAVLQAYVDVGYGDPPPCWQLAIRGESFELGEPPSPAALRNLAAAATFLLDWLRTAGSDGVGRDAAPAVRGSGDAML